MSNVTAPQIHAVFDFFDSDGGGAVALDDLGLALQALGFVALQRSELDALTAPVAATGRRHLSRPEFEGIVRGRMARRGSVEEMNKAFRLLDGDGDGAVTADDLLRAVEAGSDVGGAEARAALRATLAEAIRAGAGAFAAAVDVGPEAVDLTQFKCMARAAAGDKRHRLDESAYSLTTRAAVAQKAPYGVEVRAGETYYFCTCGRSKTQPWCDGSHAAVNADLGTDFAPLLYEPQETRTVWLCGCKQSRTLPLCDGSHAAL